MPSTIHGFFQLISLGLGQGHGASARRYLVPDAADVPPERMLLIDS